MAEHQHLLPKEIDTAQELYMKVTIDSYTSKGYI